ncbi:MAG: 7-carboxy-7-deazaguanine synthase QueE [Muribaculaceae bacterium]|nr:7-carboxy-7-deazaguanine synthase QueE [Muribaculaceae bacterium]MDE5971561.1 7-carboxy-7-deazaguanine synthase QueE [Muribaculaceae bacterium]MDE6461695.1 7-carboxy-7-deazaguanine synthase QueE [Muribaculaceae bacterium]
MRVNEIFYSIQGEGAWTGTPMVFVRFSGCNRACDFCDTNHTPFTEMTEAEIAMAVGRWPARHVVITGGEPALQLTDSLVDLLHERGLKVHVETNGSLPLPEAVDWVTCSPKTPPYGITRINELKIVFQGQDVESIASQLPAAEVECLQPLSGTNIAETVEYVKSNPRWRLSLQTHKLIEIP